MRQAVLTGLLVAAGVAGAAASPPPTVSFRLAAPEVRQGAAVEMTVWIRPGPPGRPVVRFAGREWALYRERDRWRTYLATDPTTAPGVRGVTVEAVGPAGPVVLARTTLTVRRVPFARRRLTLDPDDLARLDPALLQDEARRVARALRVLADRQLWQGRFTLPVGGRLTSRYGVISVYQGEVRGFHRGVDLAAPEGTPVRAAAGGVVRLAEELPVSGNAVLVDHGLGIVTSYLHLSAVEVAPGQPVRRGDQVGRVGATGLATGPHLHWGLRVNGVYVDPLAWVQTDSP
ncbi:MAG: M23 family metallopeptidase [Armatimonadota bacterium]|nr:M23 family metallopeptidase [Armatimonadota bacterium]MDR7404937.1 M23 family metallopeptidase [Armatimonadota bacterium]